VITLSRITIHLGKDFPECFDIFFARIDSILKDSDPDVYNQAIILFTKISLDFGKDFPERTNEFFSRIDSILLKESNLSRVTKDSYTYVIIKLRELGNHQAIEKIGELLSIRKLYFGRIAAENLGDIKSEDSLNQLIKALDSPSYRIKKHAVQGLFFAGSEQKQPYLKNAINGLTKIIKDSHKHIPGRSQLRNLAVTVLVNIGSEIAIDDLAEILRDQESISLHVKIVEYLGKFCSSKSKELLIELGLLHSGMSVRKKSFFALRKLIGEEELLKILKFKNCDNEFNDILYPVLTEGEVLKNKSKYDVSQVIDEIIDKSYKLDVLDGAIYAKEIRERLQEIEREDVEISALMEKMTDLKSAWIETGVIGIKRILRAIQSECKFYNYEIWQEAKAIQNSKLEMQNEKHRPVFQQPHGAIYVNGVLQIIEQNHGNVIGKQSPEQQ
jgi:HEAT repeat protein